MKIVIILENKVKAQKNGIPFVWNADFGFRNG